MDIYKYRSVHVTMSSLLENLHWNNHIQKQTIFIFSLVRDRQWYHFGQVTQSGIGLLKSEWWGLWINVPQQAIIDSVVQVH